MTLKDDFFTIESQKIVGDYAEFCIKLNPEHIIYKAHFPDNPITPGVCIVQMVKEVYSHIITKKFFLNKIKTLKFNHPIIPTMHEHVTININKVLEENGEHHLKVEIKNGDIIFSKINMQLKELNTN